MPDYRTQPGFAPEYGAAKPTPPLAGFGPEYPTPKPSPPLAGFGPEYGPTKTPPAGGAGRALMAGLSPLMLDMLLEKLRSSESVAADAKIKETSKIPHIPGPGEAANALVSHILEALKNAPPGQSGQSADLAGLLQQLGGSGAFAAPPEGRSYTSAEDRHAGRPVATAPSAGSAPVKPRPPVQISKGAQQPPQKYTPQLASLIAKLTGEPPVLPAAERAPAAPQLPPVPDPHRAGFRA